MQNLRDKFLKLGLVDETAVKRAEEAKAAKPVSAPRRDAPRRDTPRSDERRPEPRIPKLPPLPGSREASRQAAREQLKLDKQLRELVLANTVPQETGAETFYFATRKNKLRRMELTAGQKAKLESGELAVVERPDPDKIEHALVPAAIAEQLAALSARAVRFLNKEGAKVGFLSDEEIHARAREADEPEAAPTSEQQPAAEAGETFVTVRRSPL